MLRLTNITLSVLVAILCYVSGADWFKTVETKFETKDSLMSTLDFRISVLLAILDTMGTAAQMTFD